MGRLYCLLSVSHVRKCQPVEVSPQQKYCTVVLLRVASSHGDDILVVAHQADAIVQETAHGGELVALRPATYARRLTIDPSTRHTLGTQASVAIASAVLMFIEHHHGTLTIKRYNTMQHIS